MIKDPKNKLDIMIFRPTEGLDEETCANFNRYVEKLRHAYEGRLNTLSTTAAELTRTLALYQSEKQVNDMTSLELIRWRL